MNRENLRKHLAGKGITTENVTPEQLANLHGLLHQHLKQSELFRGTFRANKPGKNPKYLTCRADYFDNREAVSFNDDGFIGFAGWASDKSVTPIINATIEWAEQVTA